MRAERTSKPAAHRAKPWNASLDAECDAGQSTIIRVALGCALKVCFDASNERAVLNVCYDFATADKAIEIVVERIGRIGNPAPAVTGVEAGVEAAPRVGHHLRRSAYIG